MTSIWLGQVFEVASSLLSSTMVAMEITVGAMMKTGGYPSELLEKVGYNVVHCKYLD